jgi:DNA-binding response OmpR family regulator
MAAGSILIADDEDSFRESTCRLLCREGFDCRSAKDGDEALATLRQGRFDVLVSDVRMPRNADLRVVREARELDRHLRVILVTGYPSAETAISGVGMAIDAYLTKPLDIDELLPHVRKAIERHQAWRRLAAIVARLRSVVTDLELEKSQPPPHGQEGDDFALGTIRTLAACLSDLLVIWGKSAADHGLRNLCELLDCPQRPAHREAILHAIEVLEKTKGNFKSKQLAELRTNLEHVFRIK